MTELRAREAIAARALEFLVYTASRSQEVLKARWSELDLAFGVWTVPGERMKMRKEHRVPLAPPAVELLRSLHTESDNDFVFLGTQAGKPLGHTTLSALLKRMGRDVTVHGMRSAFRDWAGETTVFPHDVCEAALAHIKGKTERAYQRGDLFDRRRALMTAWAQFCASPSTGKTGCDVITVQGAR
jgi:integrase